MNIAEIEKEIIKSNALWAEFKKMQRDAEILAMQCGEILKDALKGLREFYEDKGHKEVVIDVTMKAGIVVGFEVSYDDGIVGGHFIDEIILIETPPDSPEHMQERRVIHAVGRDEELANLLAQDPRSFAKSLQKT